MFGSKLEERLYRKPHQGFRGSVREEPVAPLPAGRPEGGLRRPDPLRLGGDDEMPSGYDAVWGWY